MNKILPAVFLALTCGTVDAATQCGLVPLELEPTHSIALAVNDDGIIIGASSTERQSFIWDHGSVVYPKGLDGTYRTFLNDIDNRGRVVGSSYGSDGNQHATLWSANHVPKDLGFLPGGGADSYATAINENGHIVGTAQGADGRAVPFLWKGQKLIPLTEGLANVNRFAAGINNLDQIIGIEIEPGSLIRRAFLWEAGTVTYLGSLGDLGDSAASDINDEGQIVGQSFIGPNQLRAFLWEDGVMKNLGTISGEFSSATGINSSGVIVGTTSVMNTGRSRAFIYRNGRMTRLEPVSTTTSNGASDINRKGLVVGSFMTRENGQNSTAFVWRKKC